MNAVGGSCEQPYPLRGDVRCCLLPLNHDDDCATANKRTAAELHQEDAQWVNSSET